MWLCSYRFALKKTGSWLRELSPAAEKQLSGGITKPMDLCISVQMAKWGLLDSLKRYHDVSPSKLPNPKAREVSILDQTVTE